MNRATLISLTSPALLTSMLLVVNPAHGGEVIAWPQETADSTPAQPIFEVVFEQETSESSKADAAIDLSDCDCSSESEMLDFTDQESNAAIKRYGCDCAGCLNALRQLQGKPPLL